MNVVTIVLGVLAVLVQCAVMLVAGLGMVFDGRRRRTVALGVVILFAIVPTAVLLAGWITGWR